MNDKFSNPINFNDGFALSDCKDVYARSMLEFLVLIFYFKKPTRVTMTIANTIFDTLLEDRLVDWGLLMS